MVTRLKKVFFDPYSFAVYMLVLSYIGAPAFTKAHLGLFRKAGLAWGALLLLIFGITKWKVYLKNKYAGALVLFCIVNGITILLNWKIKLASNIFTFGYMVTSLLLIFNMFYQKDKEEVRKKTELFCWINVWIPFVYAGLAILSFVLCISGVYEGRGGLQYYGMHQNRLWGLVNPNTGGTMAMISMLFSLYLILEYKKKQKFLAVNILIQYIYMVLTQSRSAYVGFLFAVAVILVFIVFKRENIFTKDLKKASRNVFRAAVIYFCILVLLPVVKETVTVIPNMLLEIYYAGDEAAIDEEKITIERVEEFDEEDSNSISNGRTAMWQSGIKVWSKSKIWGVGANSIYEYANIYLDRGDAQALQNGSFHNVYVTTLVASGLMGLGTLILFLLLVFFRFVVFLFTGKNKNPAILMCICGAILIAELMESRILYGNTSVHYIFWMTAGILCHKHILEMKDEKI